MNLDNTHENIYIKKISYDSNSSLDNLRTFAIKNNIPIIGDEMLRFLRVILKIYKPKNILEIGTAVGYSGTNMLLHSEAYLTTIEINPSHYSKAIEVFKENNLLKRVDSRLGDAEDIIKNVISEEKKFDMVFIDGPKGKYYEHFKMIEPMLETGAVIIFDNVMYQGLIAGRRSIRRNNTIRYRMKNLVEEIMLDKKYEACLTQTEGGVLMAVKL